MELVEIMKMGSEIYSGMPINHAVFIGHKGVWRTYQSVVTFFPFKTTVAACSVNTKNLKSVLSKLNEATYKFTEKNLIIKIKNISVRLPYMTTDKSDLTTFKLLQQRAQTAFKWKLIPKNFVDCVYSCSKTISENAIHGTLTCFSFVNNEVETSNNISLSIAKLNGDFPDCLMDKQALLGAIAIEPTEYKIVEKYIIFRNKDNVIIQLPIVNGEFPDFGSIKDFECSEYIELDTEALNTIAEISEALFEGSDMHDNTLNVTIENGFLTIQNDSNTGKVEANIKVEYDKDFSFSIDSKTLQILTETNTKLGIEDSKIVVKSEGFKIISSVGE